MAAKKKGPGKGRGPATRPANPAKRVTIPKPAPPKPGATAKPGAAGSGAPGQPTAAAAPPAGSSATSGTSGAPPAVTPPAGLTPPAGAAKSGGTAKPAGPAKAGGAAKPAGPAKSAGPAKAGGAAQPPVPKGPAKASAPPAANAKAAAAKRPPAPSTKPGSSAKTAPATSQGGKAKAKAGPTREERLAAAEAARRRRSLRNRALLAGGVAAVLLMVLFVVNSDRQERTEQASQFETASCRFDRDHDPEDPAPRNHVAPPAYEVNPPAGGNHTPQAAGAGVYTEATAPPDGQIVHALEHGYVVLWHRPDLDEQSLTTIREVAARHARDVLVVPRPSIETPVAATAWHARLLCGQVEADTFERFITEFANKGPERIEHP